MVSLDYIPRRNDDWRYTAPTRLSIPSAWIDPSTCPSCGHRRSQATVITTKLTYSFLEKIEALRADEV
jgi:hypothetical protein